MLDCPGGTFQGAGVKTVVLFFEKGAPTRKVWFYQLDPGRNFGKTNPLNDADLVEFVQLQKTLADSPKSWTLDAKSIDQTTFDLSVKNPNGGDLRAGVLAMAYQLHEQNAKLQYFTHVKAEKIAHMVEARIGISLDRTPIKDAAGPNDFPHLLKVEHRARKANYFDFKQVKGAAYRVRKLGGFEGLIRSTRVALGDRCGEVDQLLQWMLPMKVRQAEIVATVFAAWNNLLLEAKRPTDEQIVFESRENWHPNKLNKIDREKFFSAVQWLRKEKMVPEGKGRRVEGKRK